MHISKASLNNLAEYLPQIANINAEKLIELTKIDFSNLSNFKIDKIGLDNLKQFADSLRELFQGNDVESARGSSIAKDEFASANERVQSSVDGSVAKLASESDLFERIAKNAHEAAEAKKEFVEANNKVNDSTESSNASMKKDKYKDRSKISEDDYTSRSDYFASIADKKLTDSGNTILGNSVNTELVDGLVKVNAKIKEADGTWKTFSAKIDADGNMFEQRFRKVIVYHAVVDIRANGKYLYQNI